MKENFISSFNEKQIEEYETETGIIIPDIQDTIFDQTPFAVPTVAEAREIGPSLFFCKNTVELSGNAFTNFYDLGCAPDTLSPTTSKIESANTPFYLKRLLVNQPNAIAAVNAGFFYLADESAVKPANTTYNLCIRNNLIVGLPAVDRPVLYVSDENTLEARELKARGVVAIGKAQYEWSGSRTRNEGDITLYNSACCTIEHVSSENTVTKRVLNESLNYTPEDIDAFDVVVVLCGDGLLRVAHIEEGGHTNIFSGNFIFHMRGKDREHIHLGDIVTPECIDDLVVSSLKSATTIGPNVHHFLDQTDHEINHDPSLGSKPPFADRRMARTIVYKDMQDKIHVRVFDGAPHTANFKGISPQETSSVLPQETVQWAYHLDPGQSSKLVLRDNDLIKTYGNNHYLRWPKRPDRPFLWSPSNGRPVASALAFYK